MIGGCGDSEKSDLEALRKPFETHSQKIVDLDKKWDAADSLEDNIVAIEELKAEHQAFLKDLQSLAIKSKPVQEVRTKLVAGHEATISVLGEYAEWYKKDTMDGMEEMIDKYHKAVEILVDAETSAESLAESKKVEWVKVKE